MVDDVETGKAALALAIEKAGSQTALADAIGQKQQNISYWLNAPGARVPAEVCGEIERATGVSRHDLRPDVFRRAVGPQEAHEP